MGSSGFLVDRPTPARGLKESTEPFRRHRLLCSPSHSPGALIFNNGATAPSVHQMIVTLEPDLQ